mgnify:CR=1 FL=1|jgi:putative oxidoreductase
MNSNAKRRAMWAAQILAAAVMGQTLYFKFSGAPEPIYIFETLGAEPWGRYGSGVLEAIAVLLLLIPRCAALGGALTMGLMAGALGAHFTKLGIVVLDDGGTLFGMALVTFAAATFVTWSRRRELPLIGHRF